jgi:hypothetical protein
MKIKVLAATVVLALVVVAVVVLASLRGGEDEQAWDSAERWKQQLEYRRTVPDGHLEIGGVGSGGPPNCPVYEIPGLNPELEAIWSQVARNRCGQSTAIPTEGR